MKYFLALWWSDIVGGSDWFTWGEFEDVPEKYGR